jgi:Cu2+-exporting ATPase
MQIGHELESVMPRPKCCCYRAFVDGDLTMQISVLNVGGFLSTLGAKGVEKQLSRVDGVKRASVNAVNGSAVVIYDETLSSVTRLKNAVEECGYNCDGEALPDHICSLKPKRAANGPDTAMPRPVYDHTGHAAMPATKAKVAAGDDQTSHGGSSDAMA